MDLLKGSVAMQEQVLACKGFLVIGYALEKVSAEHEYHFMYWVCWTCASKGSVNPANAVT